MFVWKEGEGMEWKMNEMWRGNNMSVWRFIPRVGYHFNARAHWQSHGPRASQGYHFNPRAQWQTKDPLQNQGHHFNPRAHWKIYGPKASQGYHDIVWIHLSTGPWSRFALSPRI